MSRHSGISPLAIAVVVLFVILSGVGGGMACNSCTTIEPGHVGVSIMKCNGGGVSQKPIPTGYYWKSVFCEQVEEYPTSLQTFVMTRSPHEGHKNDPIDDGSITVTSSEGLPINVDVSLSFTLDPSKVPAIYTKYRSDIEKIAHTFMRQTVREALQKIFAKYTAEQLYSDKKEIARAEVETFLTDHLGKEGFVMSQFTINEIRVPEQITAAINSKVAMVQEAQKAQQEVFKKQAQAQQLVAESTGKANANIAEAEGEAKALLTKAEAQAKANKILAESVTPALVQYETAKRWNGILPTYSGGGAVPFVQLNR